MSTKIYYGHKFNGTIKELFDSLVPIRDEYIKNAKVLYWEVWNNLKKLDKVCDIGNIHFHIVQGKNYKDFTEYDFIHYCQGSIREGLKSELNLNSGVMVFPHSNGGLYLIPLIGRNFGKNYDLLTQFSDKFKYYGYWDNTDEDENCSEEEWSERGAIWEELVGYSAMKNYGFYFSIIDEGDVFHIVDKSFREHRSDEKRGDGEMADTADSKSVC